MSRHIDFAFDRMNIKQICHFILFGVEDGTSKELSYSDRLKQAEIALNARLAALYSIDREELTMLSDDVSNAISEYKEVYFEVGVKAGARLMIELLNDNSINSLKGD